MRIGLISDTHDLLRPEACDRLQGVDHIVHGGDVCQPQILDALREIAPLTVVRGNCDHGSWAEAIPWSDTFELGGVFLHARHIREDLDLDPAAAGISVVIHGHSHRPRIEELRGVLYVNPGSAGPRRFRLPISLALLEIDRGRPHVELVDLEGARA